MKTTIIFIFMLFFSFILLVQKNEFLLTNGLIEDNPSLLISHEYKTISSLVEIASESDLFKVSTWNKGSSSSNVISSTGQRIQNSAYSMDSKNVKSPFLQRSKEISSLFVTAGLNYKLNYYKNM